MSTTVCVIVLLCIVGFVACNPPTTLAAVAHQVIVDTDVNTDGEISIEEFKNELLAKWDSDVPSDEIVSKHDFVTKWTATYHDNHHHAAQFFDNLDTFLPFGQLTEIDLLFHMGKLDPNGDGVVTTAEFDAFIHMMHPCEAHGSLHCQ